MVPSGYRSNSSSSCHRAVPDENIWEQHVETMLLSKETMLLNNALVQHNLTEDDLRTSDPPIGCRWRSLYGNSYVVVKCSDMAELKRRVDKAKIEQREQVMIDKYGKEGWKKKRQDEKERKEKTIQDKQDQEKRDNFKKEIQEKWLILMDVSNGDIAGSIEGIQLDKTNAKNEWSLRDQDLEKVAADQVGHSMKYKLRDLIRQSEIRHRADFGELKTLTKLWGQPARLREYARYLKDRLDRELEEQPAEVIQQAQAEAKAALEEKVRDSQAKVKAAQGELRKRQHKVNMFDHCVPASTFVVSSADKENATPSKKKQKVTSK
jgi:hypothetical protein